MPSRARLAELGLSETVIFAPPPPRACGPAQGGGPHVRTPLTLTPRAERLSPCPASGARPGAIGPYGDSERWGGGAALWQPVSRSSGAAA